VQNNGFYFIRTQHDNEPLSRDNDREYPETIFPFGSAEIELFAHEYDGDWNVTEKKTGLKVGHGVDLDAAQKDAHRVIDEYGGPEKFIELLKDTLERLKDGLEYDYESKRWINPAVEPLTSEITAPELSGDADA